MPPDVMDVGVAGAVALLILDRVVTLVKVSRRESPDFHRLMQQLVEAVRVKNAVDVRLEAQAHEIEQGHQEMLRIRDKVHDLRGDVQRWMNGHAHKS